MLLNKKNIKKIFPKEEIPVLLNKDFFFESSIFIPIVKIKGESHLLFQVRADNIRQGGEISFPGGKIDNGDSTIIEAAVRETKEELGISAEQLDVYRYIGAYLNPTGALVYAVVGGLKVKDLSELKINKSEVKEIFTVPVSYLLQNEPETYSFSTFVQPELNENKEYSFPATELGLNSKYEKRRNGVKYSVYVYKYNDKIIWGLTAFFTKYFIDRIKNFA